MSLVPSLLQAIVKVDGEALVLHAGEKPYVVAPAGQIELASRGLTLEAVDGIVGQLLPAELLRVLEEYGAVQYELPAAPEFPGEHFTVVSARGGDDLWTEIRRRRVPDEDLIPEEFFPPRVSPLLEAAAPPSIAQHHSAAVSQIVAAAPAPPAMSPTLEAPAPAVSDMTYGHADIPQGRVQEVDQHAGSAVDDSLSLPDANQLFGDRPIVREERGDELDLDLDLDATEYPIEQAPPVVSETPSATPMVAAEVEEPIVATRAVVAEVHEPAPQIAAEVPAPAAPQIVAEVHEPAPPVAAEVYEPVAPPVAAEAQEPIAPPVIAEVREPAAPMVAEIPAPIEWPMAVAEAPEPIAETPAFVAEADEPFAPPIGAEAPEPMAPQIAAQVHEPVTPAVGNFPASLEWQTASAELQALVAATRQFAAEWHEPIAPPIAADEHGATQAPAMAAQVPELVLSAPIVSELEEPVAPEMAAEVDEPAGPPPPMIAEFERAAFPPAMCGETYEPFVALPWAKPEIDEPIAANASTAAPTEEAFTRPPMFAEEFEIGESDLDDEDYEFVPAELADEDFEFAAPPAMGADDLEQFLPPPIVNELQEPVVPPISDEYDRVPPPPMMSGPRPTPQSAVVLPISRNPIRSTELPMTPVVDPTMSGLDRLLRVSAARGASTLYLSSDARPSVRVDGELQTIDGEPVLTGRDVESLMLTLMPERSHEALRTGGATEWILDLEDVGRVRCMSFRDHRGPGGVFRLMPTRSVSVEQLGLPPQVQALAIEQDGLVLVAGPRSSGKRTLMSAIVDQVNRTRRDHVISIEREINIVHEPRSSFISQREIRGSDDDMLAAARAALREDPDVLVIEDLRTAPLMNVALEAAMSGRLVIGGFSAQTAAAAIDRTIDLYAPEERLNVQMTLADCLRGVIVQVLLRKNGGGRVPAREVLLNTPAVSSAIAEGKTSQLAMAIEGGRRYGMMPINDTLVSLVQNGIVDAKDGYRHSTDRAGFLAALKRNGIDTSFVERLA